MNRLSMAFIVSLLYIKIWCHTKINSTNLYKINKIPIIIPTDSFLIGLNYLKIHLKNMKYPWIHVTHQISYDTIKLP